MSKWSGSSEKNEASGSKNNPAESKSKVTIGDQIGRLKLTKYFQDDSEYNFVPDGTSDFEVGDKMENVEAESFHKNKKVNTALGAQPDADILTNSTSEPVRIQGSVFIMNQEFKEIKRSYRVGSIRDVEALKKSFTRFGMTPIVLPDLKYDDIVKEVEVLSKSDFSADKLFVFAYMSHGDENEMVEAADRDFELQKTIIKPILENETLSGVAKIFITVACRGENDFVECDSKDVKKDGRLLSMKTGIDYTNLIISYSTYKEPRMEHTSFNIYATT